MIVPLTQSIASPISPSKLQGFTNSSAQIHQMMEMSQQQIEMQQKDGML